MEHPATAARPFHVLGKRTFKTVIAIFLAALFMQYVMNETPFFACIGALVAVDRTMRDSVRASIIRNVGTFTGAVVSIAISSFTENLLLISLGIVLFIAINTALNKRDSIVPGGIVYFAVAYLNTMQGAWIYGVRRVIGTLIGTLIGLAVNALIFPPAAEAKAPLETSILDEPDI